MKNVLLLGFIFVLSLSCATLIVWDESIPDNNNATLLSAFGVDDASVTSYNGIPVLWVLLLDGHIVKIPAGETELLMTFRRGNYFVSNLPLRYNFLPGQSYRFSIEFKRISGNNWTATIIIADENKREIHRITHEVVLTTR